MYSWGDSTSDWKKPGGYKYDSARTPYLDKLASASAKKGGRTYLDRSSPDMALVNPKGQTISTNSEDAIIIGVDVTGSMSSWPSEIFDRLPLLYQTLSQYKPDVEIAFGAIGDAYSDNYPLQMTNFGKALTLEDNLNALYGEGGGGGQISETYELFGYHVLKHCNMPNAKSPFLFIYGDEKFYPEVNKDHVKEYIGDILETKVTSEEVWKGLMQKFNIFYMHKPYGSGGDTTTSKEVGNYWKEALGPQRVIELPSSDRAVDVAMGIVAKYWGKFGDFTDNISARHDPKTVAGVAYSIRVIPNDPADKDHNSVIALPGHDSKAAKSGKSSKSSGSTKTDSMRLDT